VIEWKDKKETISFSEKGIRRKGREIALHFLTLWFAFFLTICICSVFA
jgi:hypothetical protein